MCRSDERQSMRQSCRGLLQKRSVRKSQNSGVQCSEMGEAVLPYGDQLLWEEMEDMVESYCLSQAPPPRSRSSRSSSPYCQPLPSHSSSISLSTYYPPPRGEWGRSPLPLTKSSRYCRNLCIRIYKRQLYRNSQPMSPRSKTNKDPFQQQLDRTRAQTEQLMRVKLGKKKVDLGARLQRKDMHNILNSLLQGEVIQEDLFNEFWTHYFRNTALLKDVLHAYNSALMMLIEKIARNNHRVAQLARERERLKQSHDFKNVNIVSLDLEALEAESVQFREDLRELSKPFQLNFVPLIEALATVLAKTSTKTPLDHSRQIPPESHGEMEAVGHNLLDFMGGTLQQAEPSEDYELTYQQKYHRFAIYISCIALVLDASMLFNKYNFLDITLGLFFVANSLMQGYLLRGDIMNRIAERVELNFIEDKLLVKDAYTPQDIRRVTAQPEDTHNYENYANSSLLLVAVAVLWDFVWLLVMNGSYYDCQGKGFTVQSASFSFWRYNRYILYGSVYTLVSKVAVLIFLTQVANLSVVRVFSRHNLSLVVFRFTEIGEALNWLVYAK